MAHSRKESVKEKVKQQHLNRTPERKASDNKEGARRTLARYHRLKAEEPPKEHLCEDCKADLSGRYHNVRFCKDCKRRHKREYERNRKENDPVHRQKIREYRSSLKVKEYSRQYHQRKMQDPEYRQKLSDYGKRYNQTERGQDSRLERKHLRRVMEKNQLGHVTKGIKGIRLEQQGFKCPKCNKEINYSNSHLDHIVPLSKGGMHDDSNLQVMCGKCNISKRDRVKEGLQTAMVGLIYESQVEAKPVLIRER